MLPVNMSPESRRNAVLAAARSPLDQGGEMRGAAQLGRARQPIGRDRHQRAVKIIRVEDGELMRATAELADVGARLGEGLRHGERGEGGDLGELAAG